MSRTLTVKKEHLTELTSDELHVVVGAAAAPPTLPLKDCLPTNRGCTPAQTPRPE